ncbi:hypothetical protein ANRL3_00143 [Anaerolineae bacterium]|nr:hypothetical protein ANRL3_00143 [Anaerolineae bacterium]
MKENSDTLLVLGEQVDRAVTICTAYQHHWGLHTRLWEAAYHKAGRPLSLAGAELIANAVKPKDTVIISAGWIKHPFHEQGEYDGYAGTASLARAINLGLGARVLIVTDEACVEPFRQVMDAAEMRVWEFQRFLESPVYRATSIVSFPVQREKAKTAAVSLLDQVHARVLIAIERSDENEYGVHHTGTGGDMSLWTAKVPYLFREAKARGIPTIGCFDMGNELGGAFIRETVREHVATGKKCTCGCGGGIAGVTETTLGVVGRSSNAAAYGIAACLAGLVGRAEVLQDRDLQRRIMERLMTIPLADGSTLVSSFTEDGTPGELVLDQIDLLQRLVFCSIETKNFPWERPPFVENQPA